MNAAWIQRLSARIATLAGVGNVAYAPGTLATMITVVSIFFLSFFAWSSYAYLALVAFSIVVAYCSIFFALPLFYNDADPSAIVIDEVAGTFITFVGIALSLKTLVVGCLLFRLFDIIKPFGIKRVERLGGAVGILADDMVAGLYANGLLHLYTWFFS